MKRKMTCLLALLFVTISYSHTVNDDDGEEVEMEVEIVDPTIETDPYQRSPIQPPTATINDHTFHITCAHPDYVLQLVDMDDNTVVYQTAMPAAISTATLPSVFTGQYRIQLIWGMWCFYGFVEL